MTYQSSNTNGEKNATNREKIKENIRENAGNEQMGLLKINNRRQKKREI